MMNKTCNIGNAVIGEGHPCYIIAEGGVNHNGDLDLAKRMIVSAKEAGADCIKFQTFKAERVVTRNAPKADYQLITTDPTESQLEMLKKLELDYDDYHQLKSLCDDLGIEFLSTPYNIEDVDFLDTLGVRAFKLASIHIAEPPFIDYVARKGKPMIVSTGMATLAEVDIAIRTSREAGNENLIILQCTTDYPAQIDQINLLAMKTLSNCFGFPIGYSDHTQTTTACIAAVALGAKVIEKHFTVDRSLDGPDQATSFTPEEFRQLIVYIREAELAMGSHCKEPSVAEKKNILGMRRSVIAKQSIPAGEIIKAEMLTLKRPALGIAPADMQRVIGCRALVNIEADQIIGWGMLAKD